MKKKVTPPKVTLLAQGNELVAKQMAAQAGDLLPKHSASVESLLYIVEGEGFIHLNHEDLPLSQGKTLVIPPKQIHQIRATTDFRAIHFMPKSIQFKFYNS